MASSPSMHQLSTFWMKFVVDGMIRSRPSLHALRTPALVPCRPSNDKYDGGRSTGAARSRRRSRSRSPAASRQSSKRRARSTEAQSTLFLIVCFCSCLVCVYKSSARPPKKHRRSAFSVLFQCFLSAFSNPLSFVCSAGLCSPAPRCPSPLPLRWSLGSSLLSPCTRLSTS